MQLFVLPPAPNAAKVIYFMREKDIADVDVVTVDFSRNEQNSPDFLARNPRGTVPVLSLDESTHLTESLTIMEYLESQYPQPNMLGEQPLEQARIRGMERFIEMNIFLRLVRIVHATASPVGLAPNPGVAELESGRLPGALEYLEARIGEGFVLHDRPTIADCTLLAGLQFAERFGDGQLLAAYPRITAWQQHFAARHEGALTVSI